MFTFPHNTLQTVWQYIFLLGICTTIIACQNKPREATSDTQHVKEQTNPNHTNDADSNSLVEVLKKEDWQVVTEADYVKYKPQNRQNEADLAFRYKAKIANNALYLLVEVQDETVVFKDGIDEVVSDHVELWVSDYAVQAKLQDFTEAHQQFIVEHEAMATKAQKQNRTEDVRFYQDALKESEELITYYQGRKDYLQILFNQKVGFVFPDKKIKPDYDFAYTKTQTGYTFELRLPLDRKFNVLSPTIHQLGFMIDVVDIDTPDATKQECLMSSSKERQYGKPNTFGFLLAHPPINISLPHTTKFDHQMDIVGIYIYNNDTYTYLVNEPHVYSGMYGMDKAILPGKYVSLVEKVVQKAEDNPKGLAMRYYQEQLILEQNNRKIAVPMDSLVNGSNPDIDLHLLYGDGEHYLLQSITPSRYPMGSGYCGAGIEMYLIYLQIGAHLNIAQTQTHHIESCFKNTTIESNGFLEDRFELKPVKDGKIWTVESSSFEDNDKGIRLKWQFNPAKPHLKIQEL